MVATATCQPLKCGSIFNGSSIRASFLMVAWFQPQSVILNASKCPVGETSEELLFNVHQINIILQMRSHFLLINFFPQKNHHVGHLQIPDVPNDCLDEVFVGGSGVYDLPMEAGLLAGG
jgi:hypothetical protein